MWEYKYTDDMYTGRFDRSEKLFHSDVYLGQDFSDGLYHWKYIKRERKNGRWVYYYKDEASSKIQNNIKKYETEYDNYGKAGIDALSKRRKLNNTLNNNKRIIDDYNNSTFTKIFKNKKANKAYKKYKKAVNKYNTYTETVNKALSEQSRLSTKIDNAKISLYTEQNKDKLRKTIAKGVAKGLDKASNTQHKLAKKIQKGKKAIAKLFKKKKKK